MAAAILHCRHARTSLPIPARPQCMWTLNTRLRRRQAAWPRTHSDAVHVVRPHCRHGCGKASCAGAVPPPARTWPLGRHVRAATVLDRWSIDDDIRRTRTADPAPARRRALARGHYRAPATRAPLGRACACSLRAGAPWPLCDGRTDWLASPRAAFAVTLGSNFRRNEALVSTSGTISELPAPCKPIARAVRSLSPSADGATRLIGRGTSVDARRCARRVRRATQGTTAAVRKTHRELSPTAVRHDAARRPCS